MKLITSLSQLPSIPAVYAMYGGKGVGLYVAYVGMAGSLRGRIEQHLIRRDSSVVTGVAAAHLNPDAVTAVCWWEHPEFSDVAYLKAAELVAFDVLEPALRSRGKIEQAARLLYTNEAFHAELCVFFRQNPAGKLVLPSLTEALFRIDNLEKRIAAIELKICSDTGST